MYRILIVDDEGIVIDSLRFMIEKHFKNTCEIETAKTGRAAIEIVEYYKPDIVFMDISMPGINGIDAIKEISKNHPNILFVILSAYDKFMYAKEAINLRVVEYLVKPINATTVTTTIEKAIVMIESKRKKRSHDLKVQEKLETVIPILESGLIYTILFQRKGKDEIDNYKNLLDITTDYGYMMVFEFGESLNGNLLTNPVGSSVRTQLNYEKLRELIKENFACIIGSVMLNRIAVLIEHKEEKVEYEERNQIVEKTRNLVINIRRNMELYCRVGIGSVMRIHSSTQSYDEAMKALLNTNSSVIHYDDLQLTNKNQADYPIKIENALMEAIQNGEIHNSEREARCFFDWIKAYFNEQNGIVKLKVLEMILAAEQRAYLSGTLPYQFSERQEYLEMMNKINNEEELQDWFIETIIKVASKIHERQIGQTSTVIKDAVEYIKKNYGKDLSLEGISQKFNISSYYFSRLFKEETGEKFIEYLTGIRLLQAKYLLKNTDKSMKEICLDVGYLDPNYFSRIFKKNIGLTPSEYREGDSLHD